MPRWKRIILPLRSLYRGVGEARLDVYAASGAFFLFLSLFPLAALACSLLPYTPLTQEMALEYLSTILPDVMDQLLREILDQVYGYSAAALSLSALVLLWSASKAFVGLLRGLNRVYESGPPINALRVRLRSGLYTLILLAVTVASLVLILFQRRLLALLVAAWPEGNRLAELLFRLRFLAAMLLLALYFTAMYKFLPAKRLRFRRQVPGALLSAALWMLLSWAFSAYMRVFGGGIYGSLATVVFALLWAYWCMYIILLGAYFNVWLEERRSQA